MPDVRHLKNISMKIFSLMLNSQNSMCLQSTWWSYSRRGWKKCPNKLLLPRKKGSNTCVSWMEVVWAPELNFLLSQSPSCLRGDVRCSGDRQVGARKRLNMARYSGFKHYCKKDSDSMSGIQRKQIKQGLIFCLPNPFDQTHWLSKKYLQPFWASRFLTRKNWTPAFGASIPFSQKSFMFLWTGILPPHMFFSCASFFSLSRNEGRLLLSQLVYFYWFQTGILISSKYMIKIIPCIFLGKFSI